MCRSCVAYDSRAFSHVVSFFCTFLERNLPAVPLVLLTEHLDFFLPSLPFLSRPHTRVPILDCPSIFYSFHYSLVCSQFHSLQRNTYSRNLSTAHHRSRSQHIFGALVLQGGGSMYTDSPTDTGPVFQEFQSMPSKPIQVRLTPTVFDPLVDSRLQISVSRSVVE